MELFQNFIEKNGLIVGFLIVGIVAFLSELFSKKVLKGYMPGSAIAILVGLVLAYFGGVISGGEKGIADLPLLKGVGTFGGSMFRDFTIVATAMGASFVIMKKAGVLGFISLIFGIILFFVLGVALAWIWGYRDAISLCTIGAGACTYIVGPVTGAALGANSEIIALSIAIGVFKAILVTILTPLLAKKVGLTNPAAAMAFGGLMGTNSGVSAGLAATDPALVPYGAVTATFYTGLGCLLCPSLFYLMLDWVF
jgi:malonate transporter MadM subunit